MDEAGAGPCRAGPEKNVLNSLDGSASPRAPNRSADEDGSRSPRPVHNISINVTDADSPVGVRRRLHLRSLSDVTPAGRSPAPRARSHSDRPRVSPAPSATLSAAPSAAPSPAPSPRRPPAPSSPVAPHALVPRAVRSERSSPDASLHALADEARVRPEADPWRKMSDVDLGRSGRPAARASLDAPHALDPWVRKPTRRAASRDSVGATPEARPRRGRLERAAGVVCESCGAAACECRRAGACTCSPRPSPARLSPRPPLRAHSYDEGRPRRAPEPPAGEAPDPLLETTC
ncbi:unnamed protein product [Euphydryas editha]|uniref:Uncharacterized protein n=1 Tax=Euphydryas editha TaxID=104508 RepID=A0AAU9UXA8_EUPED|nr:unnamed protein product [Euphydryas editha]